MLERDNVCGKHGRIDFTQIYVVRQQSGVSPGRVVKAKNRRLDKPYLGNEGKKWGFRWVLVWHEIDA
ncbi:MAG: hypothetical protein RLZZ282_1007 [Verrucomicrobiota bacterium]